MSSDLAGCDGSKPELMGSLIVGMLLVWRSQNPRIIQVGKGSKIESSLCLISTLSQTLDATSRCFSWEFLASPLSQLLPHTLALLLMFAQDAPATRNSQDRGAGAKLGLNVN